MRALVGREIVVRLHVDDEDGNLVDADALPTVAVVDGAGVAVAGVSAVSPVSTGLYEATIDPRSQLDILQATWTHTVAGHVRTKTEEMKVVGDRLAELWQLRERSELAGLTGEALRRVADEVDQWFTDALGFPPVPEPMRARFRSFGGPRLIVPGVLFPIAVYSASQGATALTADELALLRFKFGYIDWSDRRSWALDEVTVWLSHGDDSAVSEDLRRAAVSLAVYASRSSDRKIPERATRVVSEGADITLGLPDPDHPTGLPDVDAAILRHRVLVPV